MHWPEYLRPGDVLTIWEDPYGECATIEHVNIATKAPPGEVKP